MDKDMEELDKEDAAEAASAKKPAVSAKDAGSTNKPTSAKKPRAVVDLADSMSEELGWKRLLKTRLLNPPKDATELHVKTRRDVSRRHVATLLHIIDRKT